MSTETSVRHKRTP